MKKLHGWILGILFVVFLGLLLLSGSRFYEMVNRGPIERIFSGDGVLR